MQELSRFEEAYESIKLAYAIDSTVGEVNEAYKRIHKAWKDERDQKKVMYKSMFSAKDDKKPTQQPAEEQGFGAFVWGGLLAIAATAAVVGARAWLKR